MAKLTFTLNELLELINANDKLPSQLSNLEVDGCGIRFNIQIPAFLIPSLPASIKYKHFDNGCAVLEASVLNEQLNNTIGRFVGALGARIPDFIRLEYPEIFINIDKLLIEKNIRGLKVEDVSFDDGLFTITTQNTP